MKIWIKNEGGTGLRTEITREDGTTIHDILAVDIRIRIDEIITANLKFSLPGIDTLAEVTVSKEHLEELAAAHGFDLVAK